MYHIWTLFMSCIFVWELLRDCRKKTPCKSIALHPGEIQIYILNKILFNEKSQNWGNHWSWIKNRHRFGFLRILEKSYACLTEFENKFYLIKLATEFEWKSHPQDKNSYNMMVVSGMVIAKLLAIIFRVGVYSHRIDLESISSNFLV